MGVPAHLLAESLPERWFMLYSLHAGKYMLPHRRVQMQSALSSFVAVKVGGAKEAKLEDYLFDPPEFEKEAEEAQQAFGFKPRPSRRRDKSAARPRRYTQDDDDDEIGTAELP